MHRPAVSLSVLMLFLGGGMLAASSACGQLPLTTDHCGGIIPFVDDDPYFPYAYPTMAERPDGNRITQRGAPWQNYQSGCDPVCDQAVYGTGHSVAAESDSATASTTPAADPDSTDDEYVDFPYELTYDDDPVANEATTEEPESTEPPADYSESDVYEPADHQPEVNDDGYSPYGEYDGYEDGYSYDDGDSSADDPLYEYDYSYEDEYSYDDEYSYQDEYGDYGSGDAADHNHELDDASVADARTSEATDVPAVGSSVDSSLDPTDVGAQPVDPSSSANEYEYDDEYYDDYGYGYDYGSDDYGYDEVESPGAATADTADANGDAADDTADADRDDNSYDYDYDEYGYDGRYDNEDTDGYGYGYGYGYDYEYEYETDAAGSHDKGVTEERADGPADEPFDSSDESDEYEDFPYELTYDDDPAEALAAPQDEWTWMADDFACWLSHCRDRAMAWVCETGVEDSLRLQLAQIRHLTQLLDVDRLAQMAVAAGRVQPEAPVATEVRCDNDVESAAMSRWATVQTAVMLDQLGESLQRLSRSMLLRVATEPQPVQR